MKVDLPEPDGPITLTNSAGSIDRLTPLRARHLDITHPVDLGQIGNRNDRHETLYLRRPNCRMSGDPLLPLWDEEPLSGVVILVTSVVPGSRLSRLTELGRS